MNDSWDHAKDPIAAHHQKKRCNRIKQCYRCLRPMPANLPAAYCTCHDAMPTHPLGSYKKAVR